MQLFNDTAVWQRFQYTTKQPLERFVERVKLAALEHQIQQPDGLRVHEESIFVKALGFRISMSQYINPQDIHPFGLHLRSYVSELRDLQPSRLRTVLAGSGASSATTNYARSSSTKQALSPLHKFLSSSSNKYRCISKMPN